MFGPRVFRDVMFWTGAVVAARLFFVDPETRSMFLGPAELLYTAARVS